MDIVEEYLRKKIYWHLWNYQRDGKDRSIRMADKYAKILAERIGYWDEDRKNYVQR